MKSLKSLIIALAIVVVCIPAVQAQELTAEQILDKSIEASGGKAAHLAIKNTVVEGTLEITAQGISMDIKIVTAAPDKMSFYMTSEMIGEIKRGCDGETVWELSAMTGPVVREGAASYCRRRGGTGRR